MVIGHGLGGSPNGYVHVARLFTERGYDVYRMAIIGMNMGAKLHECTLAIHARI